MPAFFLFLTGGNAQIPLPAKNASRTMRGAFLQLYVYISTSELFVRSFRVSDTIRPAITRTAVK